MGEFVRDRLPDPASYFEGEALQLKGPGKWKTTRCEFHDGSDSMRINTATGAWVCMACGEKGGDVLAYHVKRNGLDFIEAAKALGAWQDDGRPTPAPKPTPLSARAAMQVLSFESTLTAIAAGNIANGVSLTDTDRKRLMVAASRITRLAKAFE